MGKWRIKEYTLPSPILWSLYVSYFVYIAVVKQNVLYDMQK